MSAAQDGLEISNNYIRDLNLVPHPEGGWFGLTFVDPVKLESPFATNGSQRAVCSVIYYLLAPQVLDAKQVTKDTKTNVPERHRSHAGYFHTNASTTSHTWHSGKAVYTLIKQQKESDQSIPEIKRVTLGSDLADGEQMQLIVPKGWWKRSELVDKADGHCLITETVCPAWDPADHDFMSEGHLQELFKNREDLIEEYRNNVLPKGHQLHF